MVIFKKKGNIIISYIDAITDSDNNVIVIDKRELIDDLQQELMNEMQQRIHFQSMIDTINGRIQILNDKLRAPEVTITPPD